MTILHASSDESSSVALCDNMESLRLHESVDGAEARRLQAEIMAESESFSLSKSSGSGSSRSMMNLGSAFVSGMLPRRLSHNRVHVAKSESQEGSGD